jgi:hypothetical protein
MDFGRRRDPQLWALAFAEASNERRVNCVGLRAKQLALRKRLDSSGVDDGDPLLEAFSSGPDMHAPCAMQLLGHRKNDSIAVGVALALLGLTRKQRNLDAFLHKLFLDVFEPLVRRDGNRPSVAQTL